VTLRSNSKLEVLQLTGNNWLPNWDQLHVSESVHPKKLVMYRKSIVTKALVAIVMVCVLACDKKVAKAGPPTPPEVFVTQVVSADVPTIRGWAGTLDGSENADIRARVTGSLQKRDYSRGIVCQRG
jgi:hypothetical protein